MAILTWTTINNGDSLGLLRPALNTFQGNVVTNVNINTADILTNAGNISSNTAAIAANVIDIATNTADIATNTADIIDLTSKTPFVPSYNYIKGAGITVTNDVYEEIIRLTTGSLDAGIYKLSQSMLYSLNSTNTSAFFRFSIDGGVNWSEIRREPKDNLDTLPSSYTSTIVHIGGIMDIVIQSRKESASDILNVASIDVIFERKA